VEVKEQRRMGSLDLVDNVQDIVYSKLWCYGFHDAVSSFVFPSEAQML